MIITESKDQNATFRSSGAASTPVIVVATTVIVKIVANIFY
jgi:hypothetical protein